MPRTRAAPTLVGDIELVASRAAASAPSSSANSRPSWPPPPVTSTRVMRRAERRGAHRRPQAPHALVVPAHVLLVGVGGVVLLGDVVAEHDVGERLEAVRDLPRDVDGEAVVAVDVDRPGPSRVGDASRRSNSTTRALPCGRRTGRPGHGDASAGPGSRPAARTRCSSAGTACRRRARGTRTHGATRRTSRARRRACAGARRRTPSMGVLSISGSLDHLTTGPCAPVGAREGAVGEREQVLAVAVLAERLASAAQLVAVDPALLVARSPRGTRP